MKKICKVCGKHFETNYSNKKYCSAKCIRKAETVYSKQRYLVRKNSCPAFGKGFKYYNMPMEICLNCSRKKCKYD